MTITGTPANELDARIGAVMRTLGQSGRAWVAQRSVYYMTSPNIEMSCTRAFQAAIHEWLLANPASATRSQHEFFATPRTDLRADR